MLLLYRKTHCMYIQSDRIAQVETFPVALRDHFNFEGTISDSQSDEQAMFCYIMN